MTCTTSAGSIAESGACPGGTPQFPQTICNLGNLPSIAYRVGDYLAFRDQLLRPLCDESALAQWRPGAQGDLAVQMIEWWAYLADILTFYNERIANEDYLLTAVLPESVNHLVQLLGYRPRPALGARTVLAALLAPSATPPVPLSAGLQVQNKPSPGKAPQTFELDGAATLSRPDVITTSVVPQAQSTTLSTGGGAAGPSGTGADGTSSGATNGTALWLAGKVGGINTGDKLLLINRSEVAAPVGGASSNPADYAWIQVNSATSKTDPLGNPVTEVDFTALVGQTSSPPGDYVLLKSGQSMPLWPYQTSSPVVSTTMVQLASIARSLTPGSLMMLDVAGASVLVYVSGYAETVWYANCGSGQPATQWPPQGGTPPPQAVVMPTATITFPAVASAVLGTAIAYWGFKQLGPVVPVVADADLSITGSSAPLAAPSGPGGASAGAAQFPQAATPVLLQGANGGATAAMTTVPAADGSVSISTPADQPAVTLTSPILVFFNLLPFSQGKTVASEVLGSGNPSVAGQDFTLRQSPVTYFADTASISGSGFTSTVDVRVNGILWQEVQSFYGQSPNAQVFVLREDDAGETHVMFGDGVNGALLPTGTNNITASYRYGAGADADSIAPDTLTIIQTPQPGLKALSNPLAPTGGSDADLPARLQSLAPESVLTFNRAVSLDDYAAIAMTAAGVTQALAEFGFDARSQRPLVQLWIAGDAGAVPAAQAALAGIGMPNQELSIVAAQELPATLSLTYLKDPRFEDAAVEAGIIRALTDPEAGLLSSSRLGIGVAIYDSQIEAACVAVPGVVAVHDICFASSRRRIPLRHWVVSRFAAAGVSVAVNTCASHRHDPGAGCYFTLAADQLTLSGVNAS